MGGSILADSSISNTARVDIVQKIGSLDIGPTKPVGSMAPLAFRPQADIISRAWLGPNTDEVLAAALRCWIGDRVMIAKKYITKVLSDFDKACQLNSL